MRLPTETTSFIGRAAELSDVGGLLRRARLVTLTGPGGVGKTRLAVRAARRAAGAMPDGACLLPLSALRDPGLLPATVATALGLPEQSARPAIELVVDFLKDKKLLLILDTCEHLIDACALFTDVVLRATDGVTLLATSRQPLDVPGENVYLVPPLPSDGADAVALFADRAVAVAPGFVLDDTACSLTLELCQRLDCIPLAIELAAVRLRALSLADLVARLGDRFQLLAGGCDGAERHQTLRMTIEWSSDLCLDTERLLWARLSVFAGEFGLDAAEAVCIGDGLSRDGVLNALIGLVDKSIVLRFGDRYRMLDTIREFGADRLAASGETSRYRTAHRDYYLEIARRFDSAFIGPDQMDWVDQIASEQANFRVALEYCLSAPGEEAAGLEMAVRLWGFWISMNLLTEGRYWMGRGLEQVPPPSRDRIRAQWLTSWFLDLQGEGGDRAPLLAPAREEAIALGDEVGLAWVIKMAACTRGIRGDMDGVLEDYADALSRMKRLGDPTGIIIVGAIKGAFHAFAGQFDECVAECDEALGRLPEGECWTRAYTLWLKTIGLWFRGDYAEFDECHRTGLRLKAPLNDLMGIAHHLEGLAWDAARSGDYVRTARLQGAADRMWREAASEPRFGIPVLHEEHRKARAAAVEALGESRAKAEFRAGSALALRQAICYAVDADINPSAAQSSRLELLTAREREVSALIAEGLTNREIAARLVVSKRTVDAHVEHVLTKLGFSSRTQIATLIAGQQTRS
ncbi:MAG: LuxR C-terminal-related transcriptional regulator [Streptosporangiaceae bacterium]